MNIEDYVYQQLTRTDEWASSETGNLRSQLFGDNEWSNVNAAEWINTYEDAHLKLRKICANVATASMY